jgi:hypothetical protein
MYDLSGELTVIPITLWWLQCRESLAVSNQAALKFDVERFNFRKLKELEFKKAYQIEN